MVLQKHAWPCLHLRASAPRETHCRTPVGGIGLSLKDCGEGRSLSMLARGVLEDLKGGASGWGTVGCWLVCRETLCLPLGSCPGARAQGGVFSPRNSSSLLTFLCKLHVATFTVSCSLKRRCGWREQGHCGSTGQLRCAGPARTRQGGHSTASQADSLLSPSCPSPCSSLVSFGPLSGSEPASVPPCSLCLFYLALSHFSLGISAFQFLFLWDVFLLCTSHPLHFVLFCCFAAACPGGDSPRSWSVSLFPGSPSQSQSPDATCVWPRIMWAVGLAAGEGSGQGSLRGPWAEAHSVPWVGAGHWNLPVVSEQGGRARRELGLPLASELGSFHPLFLFIANGSDGTHLIEARQGLADHRAKLQEGQVQRTLSLSLLYFSLLGSSHLLC